MWALARRLPQFDLGLVVGARGLDLDYRDQHGSGNFVEHQTTSLRAPREDRLPRDSKVAISRRVAHLWKTLA